MPNYQYSSDLVDDILFRAGELTDGTSDFEAIALQYLNRAYRTICAGGGEFAPSVNENWWWLMKYPPQVLTLQPLIEGTVTVTKNSTAITFASSPLLSTVANYHIKIGTHPDIFRISTHTGGQTSAVLDSVFTSDSGSYSYKLFLIEYDLASDVVEVISEMTTYQDDVDRIGGIALSEMQSLYPIDDIEEGTPTKFAFIGETKVRFSHYVNVLTRVEYNYLYRPPALTNAGSEEPVIPIEFRPLLCDIALYFLFTDKNDSRVDAVGVLAKNSLTHMASKNRKKWVEINKNMGKIYPRQRRFNRGYGKISKGVYFY